MQQESKYLSEVSRRNVFHVFEVLRNSRGGSGALSCYKRNNIAAARTVDWTGSKPETRTNF